MINLRKMTQLMSNSRLSYFSCLINFLIFELISGQSNESLFQGNDTIFTTNLTSNQLLSISYNNSIIQNKNENIIDFNIDFNQTTPVLNICDNIACINNIAMCEVNQCMGLKRIRKIHYVVTCIIVFGVILLMLATMYACRQQSKRATEWHNAHHRCEEHLMAIRILQSVNRNIEMRNIQEATPLQNSYESPPPYENQYTPPPNYEEATSHLFDQNQK